MPVLELALVASNILGTSSSMIGALDVLLRRAKNITAEELFKNAFVDAVKEDSRRLAHFTETRTSEAVEVDASMLENVIASLRNREIITLTTLQENERLTKITSLFSKCIVLPGNQLTDETFEATIRPVVGKTIADFLNQLPFNQGAFNEFLLESTHNTKSNQTALSAEFRAFLDKFETESLRFQNRIAEITQAIKNDTTEIKATTQASLDANLETLDVVHGLRTEITSASNRIINTMIADAVATEHQSEIDSARDLLNKGKPYSALQLLKKLKKRIWLDASPHAKFRILTNMGISHLILNKEQEAAKLLIEAFQYNRDDELALSNIASAYFLLGNTEKAEGYAKKTLEMNEANTSAYAILVGMSKKEETLDEVISKVPRYLREMPQIAQAISEEARQRREFEQAVKWGEITVASAQDEVSNRKAAWKAAVARILVEQITNDRSAMLTQQLDDSHKKQLKRAVELFTEAWNSIENTEMRKVATDWIIWKSTALDLLGENTAAIEAINTAMQIEPGYRVLYMKRALLALKQRDYHGSIGFLESIQTAPETPEAPILLANILLVVERLEEAITILNDFLMTDSEAPLREEANRLLIKVYVARGDFDKAQEVCNAMRQSSPKNVLFLVDAARIAKANGNNDEALSLLEEAYGHAENSESFQEITELANELLSYTEFGKAATLYEKIADTRLNSQWTQCLLDSYYYSGERKKTLEICRSLREKFGPLDQATKMEFMIYDEIGDMNQARVVGEAYLNVFPDNTEMQIRLADVYSRSNNISKLDCLLDKSFDLESLTLRSYFDLAYLYQIRSKPQRALDIMYEARRRNYADKEAHLKYFEAFLKVNKQLGELLDPTEVQPGTAVCLENLGTKNWYIVEIRGDADLARKELNVDHPLAQRLLGKTVNDEVHLQQNFVSQQVGKITEIESKYVYAYQESGNTIPELFPDVTEFGAIKLDESPETDDSERMRPLLDFINRQDENSRQIEKFYKEHTPPIGAFMSYTGHNFLDVWGILMNEPDLGIRCSVGNLEESIQARDLLENPAPRLIVDPISLLTIYRLGAADSVVNAFGKLGIAQSTIDELQYIINEREGMWADREHMNVGKEGDCYVKYVTSPEEVRRDIEYLKSMVSWIWGNCDILPCNAALEMNHFTRQKLNNVFQAVFIDTLLIASQPGYLLLSDDERLRSYAKTDFRDDAGINLDVDGVWTQAVLAHCENKRFLGKAEYNKMTIKLVCSHYYHTAFDAEVLMEAAEQSNWIPTEPYTTFIQTLANQDALHSSVLDVAADFLYRLWTKPILPCVPDHLTLALWDGLTSGRRTLTVLKPLIQRLHTRLSPYPSAKQDIFSLIEAYIWSRPI